MYHHPPAIIIREEPRYLVARSLYLGIIIRSPLITEAIIMLISTILRLAHVYWS